MTTANINGVETRYEIVGSGPPLLMFSPGGFDATIERWSNLGIYAKIKLLDRLPEHFTCIAYDRRECGQSGGRVERVGWAHFAAQGKGLLDHLKIDRAHLIGGCMGVSVAAAFAVAYPEAVSKMVLFWPVGGVKYRIANAQRFAAHLSFVAEKSLDAVVALVRSEGNSFGNDPRGGPWAAIIRHDVAFAEAYAKQDIEKYKLIVSGMGRTLVDRDTAPGAEPEELLQLDIPALIVPGRDASHATSAARYFEECLPGADYWDLPVAEQTVENVPGRVLEFLTG